MEQKMSIPRKSFDNPYHFNLKVPPSMLQVNIKFRLRFFIEELELGEKGNLTKKVSVPVLSNGKPEKIILNLNLILTCNRIWQTRHQ